MNRRPARVRVTIDQLALRGFPAEQRETIVAALNAELHRMLARPGALQSIGTSRSLACLRANPVQLPVSAGPRQIGVLAAQGLVRSLKS